MNKKLTLVMFSALLLTSCKEVPEESLVPSEPPIIESEDNEKSNKLEYEISKAYPLEFKEPLAFVYDGFRDTFVVEKSGKIYVVTEDNEKVLFIDLSSKIDDSGQEMGLLGLTFHPDYSENGYFFVNYTVKNSTVISRFQKTDNLPVNLDTEKVILSFDQPYKNHNGGTIRFGKDRFLYIASGDGGGAGDPSNNAQNLDSYLGKILRIDVDSRDEGYIVPKDNPFVGEEGKLGEIYAYGFRNPWKFSFDDKRDLLIVSDVGQDKIEEVNIVEKGKNYGWNFFEGKVPYRKDADTLKEHMPPIYQYDHSEGKSITGGEVYYGEKNPSLNGLYIYGDFVTGKIWALDIDEGSGVKNKLLLDTDLMISSFGLDKDREIIVVDFNGELYRIEEKKE